MMMARTNMTLRKAACFALVLLLLAGCARGGAPVVGISAGWDRGRIDVSDAYAVAVRAAGGVPVVLPPVLSFHEAVEALSHVDALILTGGEDVDPAEAEHDASCFSDKLPSAEVSVLSGGQPVYYYIISFE